MCGTYAVLLVTQRLGQFLAFYQPTFKTITGALFSLYVNLVCSLLISFIYEKLIIFCAFQVKLCTSKYLHTIIIILTCGRVLLCIVHTRHSHTLHISIGVRSLHTLNTCCPRLVQVSGRAGIQGN